MAKLSDAELVELISSALGRDLAAGAIDSEPACRRAAEAVVRAIVGVGAVVIRHERRHRAADGSFKAAVQKIRRRALA